MKTITVTGYEYDELDEKAKDKARDWWREASTDDSYWSESVIDDAKEVGKLMGFDIEHIYWSGFASQGDGACIIGSWHASNVKLRELKRYASVDEKLHAIVDGLAAMAKDYPNASFTTRHKDRYVHEYSVDFDFSIADDEGNEIDTDDARATQKQLIELARDFMRWIYKTLRTEWDYQNSDEQVAEAIRANEYLFTKDGKRLRVS
jgi:hypothetical protein